jgi:3-isopropylmalate/(R)-2-methylmalate dehydratase small subunit
MKKAILGGGRAWKLGDNVTTDLIISGRYFHLRSNLEQLARHVLEDAQLQGTDKKFIQVVKKGDFVVGGRNFGLGSSREHAPAVIKMAGVGAVLAQSFARIFFRNAVNIGLHVIECDTDGIEDGDTIRVDLKAGHVENRTKGTKIPFRPFPEIMLRILEDGGLVSHVGKNRGFALKS